MNSLIKELTSGFTSIAIGAQSSSSACMDNKDEDHDSERETQRRMEGFKTTKPTVMLKYPETIHFSTTCMIRGTDIANWDEIWYVSNQIDRHVCYKLDAFCNIKEDFSVTKLENQMKFLFTYGMGEVLIEDVGQGFFVPCVHYAPEVTLNILSLDLLEKQGFEVKYDGNRCTLSYMFNNKEIQFFDEDKMRTMQNKSVGIFVCRISVKNLTLLANIMWVTEGNEKKFKECYMKYLDVFTFYFKTARAPQQGYKNTLVESALKAKLASTLA
ncbi:hypothetical protein Tco_0340747 [Tanacetum coccineum]